MTTTTTATSIDPQLAYADLRDLIALQVGDEKHDEASTSCLDVLWVLYDEVLNISPDNLAAGERDRLYLSKGHGPTAYYAVLAAKGFIPIEWLPTFGDFESPLGYHPDHNLIPGVEISSGSLGHGLPLAVGTALGLGIQSASSRDARVVCLVGDGELDEGSNWEAVQYAGRSGLTRLTVVAIDNRSATHGWPGGLETRFAVEGWAVQRVDGRDHSQLSRALRHADETKPTLVVADVGEDR